VSCVGREEFENRFLDQDRLVADGWMQERPRPLTIDAEAFVTVARPDIVVGLPERRPGRQ
jgi:hypothetical protein